jgi:hypothetical protein
MTPRDQAEYSWAPGTWQTWIGKVFPKFMVGEEVQGFDASQGHWMGARITAIHGDNTFDVDWEDGDVTERFPGRQLRKPSAVKYKVGEDVEVWHEDGEEWVPVRIVCVHPAGTYDIIDRDGDDFGQELDSLLLRRTVSMIEGSLCCEERRIAEFPVGSKERRDFEAAIVAGLLETAEAAGIHLVLARVTELRQGSVKAYYEVVLEATDGDEAAAAFAGALQTHIEDETSVLRAGVGEIHLGKSRPPSAVEIVEPARLQEDFVPQQTQV